MRGVGRAEVGRRMLIEPPHDDLVFDARLDGDDLTLHLRDRVCQTHPSPAFIFQGAPFSRGAED